MSRERMIGAKRRYLTTDTKLLFLIIIACTTYSESMYIIHTVLYLPSWFFVVVLVLTCACAPILPSVLDGVLTLTFTTHIAHQLSRRVLRSGLIENSSTRAHISALSLRCQLACLSLVVRVFFTCSPQKLVHYDKRRGFAIHSY